MNCSFAAILIILRPLLYPAHNYILLRSAELIILWHDAANDHIFNGCRYRLDLGMIGHIVMARPAFILDQWKNIAVKRLCAIAGWLVGLTFFSVLLFAGGKESHQKAY